MGWPATNVTKSLSLASSTSIGSISTANGGTVTLSCTTLDSARRITVTSASLSGPTYVVFGRQVANGPIISETIIPSTTVGSAATTVQDFIQVTAVTLSCAITNSSGGLLIGTSTQGGTQWYPVDTTRNPVNLSFQLTPTSSLTATSFEYSQDAANYNPRTGLWDNCAAPTRGPLPTISSLGSSVIGPATTAGFITTPIVSWRITFTSCSSALGSVGASVLQSGV